MPDLYPPVHEGDHRQGPEEAPVVLTQFGDFECPLSHEVYVLVQKLRQAMPGELQYVYRHFPLNKVHPHAERAARAAEAAGIQGRFWEMHALLFRNQKRLTEEDLTGYAKKLALDVARFGEDLEAPAQTARIREDLRFGVKSGVDTTLNLFINGERYRGDMKVKQMILAVSQLMSQD